MGACTVGGGPYFKYYYHVVKGVDKVVPVDIYLPGCPPRPEALLEAVMRLQELVQARSKRLNGRDPDYTQPEKGSRQARIDGMSPADPWQTEKALRFDDPKRAEEAEQDRLKKEAAKKKAEEAAKKKAEAAAAGTAQEAKPKPVPKPEAKPEAAEPEARPAPQSGEAPEAAPAPKEEAPEGGGDATTEPQE
jgi:NADH ubiquinone oxidoreductase, 20 Kd subunit